MFKYINNQIDFTNWKEDIKQNEQYMPSVPLGDGQYSDTGYRIRKNSYEKLDHWFPMWPTYDGTFFETLFFNTDTYVLPKIKKHLL